MCSDAMAQSMGTAAATCWIWQLPCGERATPVVVILLDATLRANWTLGDGLCPGTWTGVCDIYIKVSF